MRKLLLILGISVIVALLSTVTSRPMLIEERLIQIQAENTLREFPRIEKEPLEVQAALLDMADDELLLLKARAAYLRYPAMTREVFPLYDKLGNGIPFQKHFALIVFGAMVFVLGLWFFSIGLLGELLIKASGTSEKKIHSIYTKNQD